MGEKGTMTRLTTVRHHRPMRTQGRGICDGEATALTTSNATEVFVRCAPIASGTSKHGCRAQSRVIYESLGQMLHQAGADLGHVVIEKAFFRHLSADFEGFQQARTEAYRRRGVAGGDMPATTYLQQPPCRQGQDVELQAYAVVPHSPGGVEVRGVSPSREHGTAKLLRIGEAQQLYVANVPGYRDNGQPPDCFRAQSDGMFETAAQILRELDVPFQNVLRTWIYLEDIDRDYVELNASRNEFFLREGVERLPASTGIGGGLRPMGNRCSLDLYALLNPEIAQIEVMQTPTLNEAHEYGSAFSRGMKVAFPEQAYLFISGTASVDEEGTTVHLDDVRGQMERMLLNIEQLLRPHGAHWADLTQAVTFLKSAEYLDLFRKICAEQGLGQAPNTIVQADVCRPELLCEMEAIAVLATGE